MIDIFLRHFVDMSSEVEAFSIQRFIFKIETWECLLGIKGVQNLDEISLRRNPIEVISGFAFAGMRNVSSIYMGYNK